MIHADLSYSRKKSHLAQASSYLKQSRRYRKILFKSIVSSLIILAICTPCGLNSIVSNKAVNEIFNRVLNNQYGTAQGGQSYSSSGNAQQFTLQGVVTNTTQDIVLLDSSAPTPVSINAPAGWIGDSLSGTMEFISTRIGQVRNGLLDTYHSEHFIVPGSTQSSYTVYVPDHWTLIEKGEVIIHPHYGRLYFLNYATGHTGRNGTMGW
ncbi:MAG: hypothetical protein ACFFCT_13900, partial [Candidatus Odinarchaeota archaeon]